MEHTTTAAKPLPPIERERCLFCRRQAVAYGTKMYRGMALCRVHLNAAIRAGNEPAK